MNTASVKAVARHARQTITLLNAGKSDIKLPPINKAEIVIKAGGEAILPIGYFHACAASLGDLIVSGVLQPVCRDHFFDDGPGGKHEGKPDHQVHCRDCNQSRATVKAAPAPEAAKAAKKGKT